MARDIHSQQWLQLDDGRIWKCHVDHLRRSEVGVEKTPPPDIAVTPQTRTPQCLPQALRAPQVTEEVSAAASLTKTQVQEQNVRREQDGQKEKVCKETVTTDLRRSTQTI